VSTSRVANLARTLGWRKAGAVWMARCPGHDDQAPSLAIAVAKNCKVVGRCQAGCDQRDVIAALRPRGVWQDTGRGANRFMCKVDREPSPDPDLDALKRTGASLAVRHALRPAEGKPVEAYLRSRGLAIAAPHLVRFHAGLKHPSGHAWPAMAALVTDGKTGLPIAIHRTFLARDGGSKAPAERAKMMLGPCRGGAVRPPIPRRNGTSPRPPRSACCGQTGARAWIAFAASRNCSLSRCDLRPYRMGRDPDPGQPRGAAKRRLPRGHFPEGEAPR
jgi:putative DNA primase/helicase